MSPRLTTRSNPHCHAQGSLISSMLVAPHRSHPVDSGPPGLDFQCQHFRCPIVIPLTHPLLMKPSPCHSASFDSHRRNPLAPQLLQSPQELVEGGLAQNGWHFYQGVQKQFFVQPCSPSPILVLARP